MYGDELSDKKWIAGEKIKIYDAAIIPDFSLCQLEEDELLFRLRKAVEDHPWIKIWNLAISIRAVSYTHLNMKRAATINIAVTISPSIGEISPPTRKPTIEDIPTVIL